MVAPPLPPRNFGIRWCWLCFASAGIGPEWKYATTWTYRFEPDGDGVMVTESFDSPMLGSPDIYPGKLEGRCEQLRAALATTLDNLKTALES